MQEAARVGLIELLKALQVATYNGALDELAAYLHPDAINKFCDEVSAAAQDAKGYYKTSERSLP